MADEGKVLQPERLIEAQLLAERGDGIGRCVFAEGCDGGIAGKDAQREEDQGQHKQHGRDDFQAAAQNVAAHR